MYRGRQETRVMTRTFQNSLDLMNSQSGGRGEKREEGLLERQRKSGYIGKENGNSKHLIPHSTIPNLVMKVKHINKYKK